MEVDDQPQQQQLQPMDEDMKGKSKAVDATPADKKRFEVKKVN